MTSHRVGLALFNRAMSGEDISYAPLLMKSQHIAEHRKSPRELNDILMQGALQKLSATGRWQKRWFVLHGRYLKYYHEASHKRLGGVTDLSQGDLSVHYDQSTSTIKLESNQQTLNLRVARKSAWFSESSKKDAEAEATATSVQWTGQISSAIAHWCGTGAETGAPQDDLMCVTVHCMGGEAHSIELSRGASVAALKQALEAQVGHPAHRQALFAHGHEEALGSGHLLRSYNVREAEELLLVLQPLSAQEESELAEARYKQEVREAEVRAARERQARRGRRDEARKSLRDRVEALMAQRQLQPQLQQQLQQQTNALNQCFSEAQQEAKGD